MTQPEEQNMEKKILAAAEKLFLRKGYPLTSTTEIAKEAGCNQALVHYYFRTKEKLFQVVLSGKIKRVFNELISLEVQEGNFKEKLVRMITAHFDILRENADMVMFLLNGLTRDPSMFDGIIADVREVSGTALENFRREFEREVTLGRIRPIPFPQLLLTIVSLNVFPFAIQAPYKNLWRLDQAGLDELLDQRRQEGVTTVLMRLYGKEA